MSDKYDDYLKDHLTNVRRGLSWMLDHFDNIPVSAGYLNRLAEKHDSSKFSNEEYDAYDEYFYDKDGKDEEDKKNIDEAFDYAWLNHIHHNKHHWQYWVLIEGEGKEKALEMPDEYVYEMVADWWSFSWKSGKLEEIFSWYDSHKDNMILHPVTKTLVESILDGIKKGLEDDKKEDKK